MLQLLQHLDLFEQLLLLEVRVRNLSLQGLQLVRFALRRFLGHFLEFELGLTDLFRGMRDFSLSALDLVVHAVTDLSDVVLTCYTQNY